MLYARGVGSVPRDSTSELIYDIHIRGIREARLGRNICVGFVYRVF